MKLPSSPVIVYAIIYSILFSFALLLHFTLLPFVASTLARVYLVDFGVTCCLFAVGNLLFASNNIYDLHWPCLPLTCTIYFHFATNPLAYLSAKQAVVLLLVLLWSFHLIWQTVASCDDIRQEDWRYQMFRKRYPRSAFLLFAFFALHVLPMLEVLIGTSSIYYVFVHSHRHENLTIADVLVLSFVALGVLLENLADRQLREFRRRKQRSRDLRFAVLAHGLWKYSRHPNYLGEMMFWWGLFFAGLMHDAPLWCGLGPLLITLMMIFGSIPMSEERMFRKYPEYKFVQQKTPMLIPAIGF